MGTLEGNVAIMTGSTSGIGARTAAMSCSPGSSTRKENQICP